MPVRARRSRRRPCRSGSRISTNAIPRNMPIIRAREDVADLPQLAAQPAPLGLERRPPHQHAGEDEARVLGDVHEVVPHRALEREARGASRRARPRRRGAPRAAGAGCGTRRAAGAARERHEHGARQEEHEHRVAQPASSSGAPRSASSRCSAMCALSSSSASESIGRQQRDRLQRRARGARARPASAGRATPRPPQHPQRAHVERLGDDEPDDDRHRPLSVAR